MPLDELVVTIKTVRCQITYASGLSSCASGFKNAEAISLAGPLRDHKESEEIRYMAECISLLGLRGAEPILANRCRS